MDQQPLPPPQFGKDHLHNHHQTIMMIEHMLDSPQRNPSLHRRALSDTSFLFDDLLQLDPSEYGLLPSPSPTPPHATSSMSVDDPLTADAAAATGGRGHFRSLSVDADFFDGLGLGSEGSAGRYCSHRNGHRQCASMDGLEFEGHGVKKAIGADRLAELALFDPKRAKRILANRQSAVRSKERKIKYTSELVRKVQTLQTAATTLSAQVSLLQRDSTGLTARNKELKLRLQAMEQQAQLRDALNEALRDEVQSLKIAASQIPTSNGNSFGQTIPQYTSRQPQPQFGNNSPLNQLQTAKLHRSSDRTQKMNGQPQPNFLDFKPSIQQL